TIDPATLLANDDYRFGPDFAEEFFGTVPNVSTQLVDGPSHGYLTFLGSYVYVPAAGYVGPDSFSYRLTDGGLLSNVATVTLDVPNPAPAGAADYHTVGFDQPLDASPGVLANDADMDGDPLTVTLVSGPSQGTLDFHADGTFRYTPAASFYGTDSF